MGRKAHTAIRLLFAPAVVLVVLSLGSVRAASQHGVAHGGCLVRLDPATGAILSIARCREPSSDRGVAHEGCLVRLDPATGAIVSVESCGP